MFSGRRKSKLMVAKFALQPVAGRPQVFDFTLFVRLAVQGDIS